MNWFLNLLVRNVIEREIEREKVQIKPPSDRLGTKWIPWTSLFLCLRYTRPRQGRTQNGDMGLIQARGEWHVYSFFHRRACFLVQSLQKNELWRACSVHQRNGTQWLQKERQYSESHKSIFNLNKNWTNMRAPAGDSPEIPKRPFFRMVEDWLILSKFVDLVDVSEQQSNLAPRRMTCV